MGKNLDLIKGFMTLPIITTLGSSAIQAVGNIGSGLSTGMRSATQSVIGAGVAFSSMKLFKIK